MNEIAIIICAMLLCLALLVVGVFAKEILAPDTPEVICARQVVVQSDYCKTLAEQKKENVSR